MSILTDDKRPVAADLLVLWFTGKLQNQELVYDQLLRSGVRGLPTLSPEQRFKWGLLEMALAARALSQDDDRGILYATVHHDLTGGPNGDVPGRMFDEMMYLANMAPTPQLLYPHADCGLLQQRFMGVVLCFLLGHVHGFDAAGIRAVYASGLPPGADLVGTLKPGATIPMDYEFWDLATRAVVVSTDEVFKGVLEAAKTAPRAFKSDEPTPKAQPVQPQQKASGCFVATAVYAGPDRAPVRLLRRFRDTKLRSTAAGQIVCRVYQFAGPIAARAVSRRPRIKRAIRRLLTTLCWKRLRRTEE